MLLLTREELEESLDRQQQYFRISLLEVRSRKEVGANHLQAISARLVGTQHERRGLECLFDDGDLALVDLEIRDLVWL